MKNLVLIISSVSCSILQPTQRFPIPSIHPLIAYAATSVSGGVINNNNNICGVLLELSKLRELNELKAYDAVVEIPSYQLKRERKI